MFLGLLKIGKRYFKNLELIRNILLLSVFVLFTQIGMSQEYITDDDTALTNKLQKAFDSARQLVTTNQYKEAESKLIVLINNYDNEEIKVKSCMLLSELYYILGDAHHSLHYANLALEIPLINDNPNYKFNIYTILFITHMAIGNEEDMLFYQKECKKLMPQVDDTQVIAKFLYTSGKYHIQIGDYLQGSRDLLNAARQYNENIITPEYGRVLLMIARMYQTKNDFGLALKNAEEAYMIFEKQKYNISKIDALCLIGDLYLSKNQKTEALGYYTQAKEISDSISAPTPKVTSNLCLAIWHLYNDDLNTAIKYYHIVNCPGIKPSDKEMLFRTYLAFSVYYLRHDKAETAEQYAIKADEYCDDTLAWGNLRTLSQLYGDIYFKKGDFEKSAQYYQKSRIYSDSLYYRISLINSDPVNIQSELDRQNNLIHYLTNENISKESAIESNNKLIDQQKSSINTLVGLSIIAIIVVLLLVWLFIEKFRDNKTLQQVNKKIIQQKEEIQSQKEHLVEYTTELEKLSLIARETDNAIRVFDNKGNTTWINPCYTRLYGFTLDDLQADNTLGLNSSVTNIDNIIKSWDTEKISINFESEIINKWNVKLWIQTTISPVFDNATFEIKSLIAIDTNITSLKKTQQDVINMNEDITSSITYAKRIQEAMLPPFSTLTQHYPNSFKYYKPRSIVSGDFYWMTNQNNRIIVACADSTGHGVPGAFLSLIGISFLSKIVNERGIVQAAPILNRLRMNIIDHLHQSNSEMVAGDGMDMSLISIDKESYMLEFAGAMNPMYIIRDNNIIELKPDRMPIGFYDNEDRSFSASKVQLKPNDHLYMFTDGYYDQFGGDNGLKMKASRFKQILLQCCQLSANEQIDTLETEFNNWRGSSDQVDDILIIGIKIE